MKVTKSFTVETRGIGHPDYAAPKPVGQVPVGPIYTVTDIGELAARLGSIVTFDRRGNVIWLDDFEGTENKWFLGGSGEGYNFVISAEAARNGCFSGKLNPGILEGNTGHILHTCPYPVLSKLGLECSFTWHAHIKDISFRMNLYTGKDEYWANIKYDGDEEKLYYRGTDVLWHEFASDISLYIFIKHFHTAKLVADFTTGMFERFILNNREYDLSSYKLYTHTSDYYPSLHLTILSTNGSAGIHPLYIEDVIITQNEP